MEIKELKTWIDNNLTDKNGNLHPFKFNNKCEWLKTNHKDIYDMIIEKTSFLNEYYDDIDIKQRIWHIRNNDLNIKYCKNDCGKVVKFRNKYLTFCSQSCISSYSNRDKRNGQWQGGVKKLGLCSYKTWSKKIDKLGMEIEYRKSDDNDKILEIKCDWCYEWYKPKYNDLYWFISLNKGTFLMCSDECKNENPLWSRNGLKGLLTGDKNPSWTGGWDYVSYDVYFSKIDFCEEVKKEKGTNALLVKCKHCKEWFRPTRMDVYVRRNGLEDGKGYFYCSDKCKHECNLYGQRTYYRDRRPYLNDHVNNIHPQLREMCFERDDYTCQICGGKNLICHHIDPIINNPIESADLDNTITLCIDCHKNSHKLPKCSTGYLSTRCVNGY